MRMGRNLDPNVLGDSLSPGIHAKARADEGKPPPDAAPSADGGGEAEESEIEDMDPMLEFEEHEHCTEAKKYLKPEAAHLIHLKPLGLYLTALQFNLKVYRNQT